jgi:RNA polymerase sigma-70 factor (ECF subfamily)
MADDASFADLLFRLRTGDQAAAALVVDRYTHRLVALARGKLDGRIRQKEDAEDVLQSVFKSFFHRFGMGQFQLDSSQDLWALLVSLTLHKCGHRADYFRAAKRNVQRETRAEWAADASCAEFETLAREPTPVEAAILAETVDRLLQGLESRHQEIVRLSLEGEPTAAIADRCGVTQKTVQRVLKGVRERLERWRTETDAAHPEFKKGG